MKNSNLQISTSDYGCSSVQSTNGSIRTFQLMKLFEDELKDIYWTEKVLTKAIPKMVKNATCPELIYALSIHLEETENQILLLEQVFESIGKKVVAKRSESMDDLIKDASMKMEISEPGAMCDAVIISTGRKIEHYEIASYGTLIQFADILGLDDAMVLLQSILDEEIAAAEILSEVAFTAIDLHSNFGDEDDEESDQIRDHYLIYA